MIKPTAAQRKRNRRYLWLALGILMVIMAAGMFAINYSVQYEGDTTPMVSVANQLKTDPSWKLTVEDIEPPRIVCVDDGRCPSLQRIWKVGKNLTKDEFQAVLQRSGWDFPVDRDCTPQKNVIGTITTCEARGAINGFRVILVMDGSYDRPEMSQIILYMHELDQE